ncbi:hypothetical protein ACOQFO_06830 [Ureibacillus sp. MALMAid1270]|uniref:hypothetical protein n=1 Tax=Ureibacillus sp. MALMAid1270 TaxID=3411629 RepID=UPI003BA63964
MDLFTLNPATGKVEIKQRRYFDINGWATRDIDYFHSGVVPFPHYHNWLNQIKDPFHFPAVFE